MSSRIYQNTSSRGRVKHALEGIQDRDFSQYEVLLTEEAIQTRNLFVQTRLTLRFEHSVLVSNKMLSIDHFLNGLRLSITGWFHTAIMCRPTHRAAPQALRMSPIIAMGGLINSRLTSSSPFMHVRIFELLSFPCGLYQSSSARSISDVSAFFRRATW